MLELRDLRVEFDGTAAVDGVDLDVPDGEIVAVLGPSGCGKSTLLRAVAGLEPLAGGSVGWDGADLQHVPTHRRGFGLMFQDGQLFDHLTVARNVGYALAGRGGVPARERTDRVAELLELVGLRGYADRLPRTLSGGERQRVALARSLAAQPRLLLLDEPLSALDAALRTRLAADLRRILTTAGTTALLVTHDQEEAFAMADRLAVMRTGRVVQSGTTTTVWSAPVDEETARFLGFTRVLRGPAAHALVDALATDTGPESGAGAGLEPGRVRALRDADAVAVRPSAVVAGPDGALVAEVVRSVASPDGARLVVAVPGIGELDAIGAAGRSPAVGETVRLRPVAAVVAPVGTSPATSPTAGPDPADAGPDAGLDTGLDTEHRR